MYYCIIYSVFSLISPSISRFSVTSRGAQPGPLEATRVAGGLRAGGGVNSLCTLTTSNQQMKTSNISCYIIYSDNIQDLFIGEKSLMATIICHVFFIDNALRQ